MNPTPASARPTTDPGEYYLKRGYVILEGLVPATRIDAVLERYLGEIRPSSSRFFRQNTSRYEPNRFNLHGHVCQSFLDVHGYDSHPEFRDAVMEIYFSDEMRDALTRVTGSERHHLMQSMLFDLNAATPPHQDWWYLDSVPGGGLVAAWIALEDIEESAGRFYVIPGSQDIRLHEQGLSHSKWLERVRTYVDERQGEVHAPAMKKGDVLFWNSRTIHGALDTVDGRHSRKSLTAHYLPSTLPFGNLFTEKPWVQYREWRGHRFFVNQPEYSLKADVVSRAKNAVYDNPGLLRLARKFQRRSISDLK